MRRSPRGHADSALLHRVPFGRRIAPPSRHGADAPASQRAESREAEGFSFFSSSPSPLCGGPPGDMPIPLCSIGCLSVVASLLPPGTALMRLLRKGRNPGGRRGGAGAEAPAFFCGRKIKINLVYNINLFIFAPWQGKTAQLHLPHKHVKQLIQWNRTTK